MPRSPKPRDRRVERTQRLLREALIAEILAKGYDAVTVQDIIDRADVGRSTFYTHFADKEALLVSGIGELKGFLAGHRQGERPLAFSRALFEHIDQMRDLGRATFGRRSGAAVQDQMRRMFAGLVREDLAALAARRAPATPLDAVVEYVTGALIALIAWWIDRRTKLTAAEIDDVFRALVMPGVDAAFGDGPRGQRTRISSIKP
jgi:AcrR family transcriptional regulator